MAIFFSSLLKIYILTFNYHAMILIMYFSAQIQQIKPEAYAQSDDLVLLCFNDFAYPVQSSFHL